MIELDWGGESWTLLSDRAVWWAARRTLVVADMHLGKAATFRAAGIPVPESVTVFDLDRLSRLLREFAARRLLVLGDLLHAPAGMTPDVLDRVTEWRAAHRGVEIVLIRGNHDRRVGRMPREWEIDAVEGPLVERGVALAHEPFPIRGKHVLAGHIHPGVRLRDAHAGSLHAPCFWFAPRIAVLPAFGSFTGCATVRPGPRDRVYAAGPGCVEPVKLLTPTRRRLAR